MKQGLVPLALGDRFSSLWEPHRAPGMARPPFSPCPLADAIYEPLRGLGGLDLFRAILHVPPIRASRLRVHRVGDQQIATLSYDVDPFPKVGFVQDRHRGAKNPMFAAVAGEIGQGSGQGTVGALKLVERFGSTVSGIDVD